MAEAVGVPTLFLKREDLHPLGSHKGRSIPYMIDTHLAAGGKPYFIISSSGNAALAAGLYVKELNEKRAKETDANQKPLDQIILDILVGQNINQKKLAKIQALRDDNIAVAIHDRPLQILNVKTHEDPTIKSLRQSTDDTALAGYASLASELSEIPNLQAVFIGTSSGTTAEALASYFLKNKNSTTGAPTEVHIIQTPSCHPIAEAFGSEADAVTETGEKSIADAIVDQTAFRKNTLLSLLEKINGTGWIADNESIKIAQELTQKHANLSISTNSALSVAGLMNAVYTGRTWDGAVACIIAGE